MELASLQCGPGSQGFSSPVEPNKSGIVVNKWECGEDRGWFELGFLIVLKRQCREHVGALRQSPSHPSLTAAKHTPPSHCLPSHQWLDAAALSNAKLGLAWCSLLSGGHVLAHTLADPVVKMKLAEADLNKLKHFLRRGADLVNRCECVWEDWPSYL